MASERIVLRIDEKGAKVVSRNIENLGRSAQKAGGGVKLLRSALGALGAISIGLVLRDMVKTLASFSQEMSTVAAITGAVGQEFDDLRMKARDLGANTRFSATQAAEGMTFLARAGFETNEIMASIGPTLQLAQAGALELGRAADIASNVLTGFNIAATDSQRVIDVLALAANSANTNVEQLGEAMSYVAPISATLGVSLEETAAGVQVLSDAGIQASRAGTNLTMVMRKLEAPQGKQKSVLKDLGLALEDVRVSEVGLTQALQNLKAAGASQTQIFELFGRSAAAASVLLEGTNGKIQDFTKANREAEGTAARVAAVMDDNLNGALLAVRSAFEELQLAFGDLGTESALTQTMKALAKVLRGLAANLELVSKNVVVLGLAIAGIRWAGMIKGIAVTATSLTGLNGVLTTVRTTMASLALNPLTVGLLAAAAAVMALNMAFDAFNKLAQEAYDAELEVLKIQIRAKQKINEATRAKRDATKALEGYIKNLELENTFSKMTEAEQVKRISLAEAEGLAKRKLTEGEAARVTAALAEKDAIAAANKVRQDELAYLQGLQEPAQKYAAELALLNSELVKTTIGAERHAAALAALKEKYDQGPSGEEQGQALIDGRTAALMREREMIGLTNEQRQRAIALMQLEKEVEAAGGTLSNEKANELDLLLRGNQAMDARAQVIQDTLGPLRAFAETQAILNELIAEGGPNVQAYKDRLKELQAQLTTQATDPNLLKVGELSEAAFDSATQSVLNFTETGKFAVREFVADMVKQMAKLAAMKAFAGIGGALGLPSFKAEGGPVTGGQPYIVGERGPELMVPGSSGTVIPNHALTASVPSAAAPQLNVKIVNVMDPAEIVDAMNSDEGEETVLNIITRNSSTVRQAVS